ncbi:MAG: hypothetical protein HC831_00960 [Chloroflexia bacterium]|nr:hypothetical protein [Chloroflexia bacterium]
MRKYALLLLLTTLSIISFAQDIPDLESLLKPKYESGEFKISDEADKNFWREKDEVVLICIDFILQSKDGFQNKNRTDMASFVHEWIIKSKYDLPYQDKLAKELSGINMYVWYYYMLGASKKFLENKDKTQTIFELQLLGLKTLRDYFSDKNNFDESSDIDLPKILKDAFFIKLEKAKSDKKLKKIINHYAVK